VTPGELICSPINGTVTRIGYCYESTKKYKLVEILDKNKQSIWRLLYLDPTVVAGEEVSAGTVIGAAMDISEKYSTSMIPHVHVEVVIDPTTLMKEV
jgi:hypothetical protein